jgi:hypothetical protein
MLPSVPQVRLQRPTVVAEVGFILAVTKFVLPSFSLSGVRPVPFSSSDVLLQGVPSGLRPFACLPVSPSPRHALSVCLSVCLSALRHGLPCRRGDGNAGSHGGHPAGRGCDTGHGVVGQPLFAWAIPFLYRKSFFL